VIQAYLVSVHSGSQLREHISFDSSAIEVAEKAKVVSDKKRNVLEQLTMNNEKILSDLPNVCNFGTKQNSNGKTWTWKGYKLHVACDDYSIPLSSIVTSASVHDSLCAVPLIRNTERLVDALYYLGDKGYDAEAIRTEIESHDKVAIIDFKHNRNGQAAGELIGNKKQRYGNRSRVEGLFGNLKLNYLPRYILYRSIEKVKTVLNLALSVIAALQIIKYAT
jgi:IS5 family transposase